MTRKVIVLGIDGLSWKIIDNNIIPSLRGIIKYSTYGILQLTIPPITGPAWVSFATGKNPGKHGCYDFLIPKDSLKKLKPISTKNIKSPTFYELLESQEKNIVLINLPCSHPPRIKNGVIVADFLTGNDQKIYPKSLERRFPEIKNYRLSPKGELMNDRRVKELVNDILEIEKIRFQIAKKLLKNIEWDLFFVLFSGTDWIQHLIYDKIVENKETHAIKIYRYLDEIVRWFIENLPEDSVLMIMSDHGFDVYKRAININDWLVKNKFLELKEEKSTIYQHKVDIEIIKAKKRRLKINIPIFLVNIVQNFPQLYKVYTYIKRMFKIEIGTKNYVPVIERTIAYCTITGSSNFSGIYINDNERFVDGIIKKEEYEKIREKIMSDLKKIKEIKNIWKKEEIYRGEQIINAPDIIIKSECCILEKSYNHPLGKICGHSINGIFITYGKGIKKGCKIENARIIDVAPTILHIFGLPIPKDMDGRVLTEIFEPDSEFAKRVPKYVNPDYYEKLSEKQRIKKKITKRMKKMK